MNESRLKELIKLSIILSLFCVFLVIVDISTTVVLHNRQVSNSNKIIKNSIIIKEAEYRTCERINTLRISVNNAHWVTWLQLEQSVVRSYMLAKNESKNAFIRIKGAKESKELASKLTWTKLTNCYEAVYHPSIYIPPVPTTFNKYNLKFPPDSTR